jgi:RNA polymerase sigma-70 factor (ECF subfamily)
MATSTTVTSGYAMRQNQKIETVGSAPEALSPHGSTLTLLALEFEQFHALVYRYLLHRLFDPELAEELTAQTFCKAAGAIDRIQGDARQIRLWLLRTATNLANTHHRWNRVRQLFYRRLTSVKAVTTETDPASVPSSDQRLARIRGALLTLRPKYQTVVVLRYYSQMSFTDIAAVTGYREDTVRTRLSRAIKEMRARLCLNGLPDC